MEESTNNRKRSVRNSDIETSSTSFSCKNPKTIGLVDFELENPPFLESSGEKNVCSHASSHSGGASSVVGGEPCSSFSSDCSSNESFEFARDSLRNVDLEAKSFETEEIATCINKKSRETTSSSELCKDSKDMDSTAQKLEDTSSINARISATKVPSQADIDEFFSAAEKYELKRCTEKYNFDFVNDSPLEGRFQWVRLSHENSGSK